MQEEANAEEIGEHARVASQDSVSSAPLPPVVFRVRILLTGSQ